ncbi:MAG TPA: hypothetical protein VF172_08680 [Nitrososphaera sp.]
MALKPPQKAMAAPDTRSSILVTWRLTAADIAIQRFNAVPKGLEGLSNIFCRQSFNPYSSNPATQSGVLYSSGMYGLTRAQQKR